MKKILLFFLGVWFIGINSVFAEEVFLGASSTCPMGIATLAIQFETNGGSELDDMYSSSHIALPEGSTYWPIPTKSGYEFEGWYYDVALTQKLDAETIGEIKFEPQTDANGCTVTVHKTLYAKWNTTSNNETNSSDISDSSIEDNSSIDDNSSLNPSTGAFVSVIVISGLLIVGIFLYSVFKKYTKFKKI